MDSKMEQLKEGYNEEEQLETSKKRPKKNSKSFKILIFVTIISCLLNIFLFYKLFTKNDLLDLAESRFALRQFSNKTIEQEKIDKLLRVAQIAPTAENKQPQKIYIITKDEDRKKLKTVTKYTFNAPMFFLVCCDKNIAWKHKTEDYISTEIDGSIVTTHITLEAHDLGLGSVIVRSFETQKLKDLFKIPENMIPIALLPLGYPKEGAKPSKLHFQKKDVKEMVEYL
jgi:nitroreductase